MLRALVCVLLAPALALAGEAPEAVEGALTVNVQQARQLHELGAVFIDVRPEREWRWGHVEGALHLDLASRFGDLADRGLPRQVPLVVYCDSEVCASSAAAARLAVAWGYRQVFYFREGYFAWQLADFPQAKGLGEPAYFSALAR
ncbi:rhodanese-like domain-containing protein [Pseudomonas oligotrophica]|uniref:rhodanese-like domain-containing protein n=1 Tax=Pseudomonas oligotrophica TaxID=2912055 RepID=UPI001F1C3F94|nr:rhodanese-like domain-containing protein [Pseudomonas oligotrophica]MCF7202780.1 rhodanese-like domain-containing protein [Pseudomonas oligotrophica]